MTFLKTGRPIRYSIKNLYLQFMGLVLLISITASIYNTVYIEQVLRRQYNQNLKTAMNLYCRQIKTDLFYANSYLQNLSTANGSFSIINTTDHEISRYKALADIRRTLETAQSTLSGIDGLFCYSTVTEDYIYSMIDSDSYSYVARTRSLLREHTTDLYDGSFTYLTWTSLEIDGTLYLEYLFPSGKNILGTWVHLDNIEKALSASLEKGTIIELTDREGQVLSSDAFSDTLFHASDPTDTYRDSDGQQYVVTMSSFPDSHHYLLALTPHDVIRHAMQPVLYRQIFVMIVMLVSIIILVVMLSNILNVPFQLIQRKVAQLKENPDIYQEPPAQFVRCKEYSEIYDGFSELSHQISELKIDIYEKELQQKSLELRHLRSQVAPHFLINCLSTISYLGTSDDIENARPLLIRLLESLSNHLRYTLSDNKEVSLACEKRFMENYLELSMIRFPGSLTYSIDIPAAYDNVSVFPMMLLTLTENAIKHNRIMGRSFEIRLSAYPERCEDGDYLHFVHTDTGKGFSPEQLTDLNRLGDTEPPAGVKDGHNIGLYNIAQTLSLTFPGQASIHFENTATGGARIDIRIPLKKGAYDEHSDRR